MCIRDSYHDVASDLGGSCSRQPSQLMGEDVSDPIGIEFQKDPPVEAEASDGLVRRHRLLYLPLKFCELINAVNSFTASLS